MAATPRDFSDNPPAHGGADEQLAVADGRRGTEIAVVGFEAVPPQLGEFVARLQDEELTRTRHVNRKGSQSENGAALQKTNYLLTASARCRHRHLSVRSSGTCRPYFGFRIAIARRTIIARRTAGFRSCGRSLPVLRSAGPTGCWFLGTADGRPLRFGLEFRCRSLRGELACRPAEWRERRFRLESRRRTQAALRPTAAIERPSLETARRPRRSGLGP